MTVFASPSTVFSHHRHTHTRTHTLFRITIGFVCYKIEFLCELFFVGVITLWSDFLIIFRYDANALLRMEPIFQQPMRRVRHDLMGHLNFLALAHWQNIVQIYIYYDFFQSFFNEHEYRYAVDAMTNSIHVCFEE
jgi:hypothetical protein